MKIFLTGVTGYIGSAVAAALADRGHEVTGLARDPKKASGLPDRVSVVQGDLESLDDHRNAIAESEVYVHAAMGSERAIELDEKAIYAFTRHHDKRHFIYTSGVWVLGNTGALAADEVAPPNPLALVAWRPTHERYVLEEARDNFTTTVLRPGCVYGGRQSLLRGWFAAAQKGEPVDIVGSGTNHWAMIHLDDLVRCYARAVEKRAGGVLHAVDDSRATLRACADAVIAGSGKKSEVRTTPLEQARKSMGPFADALAVDQNVASNSTRYRLGWKPERTFTDSIDEQWRVWKQAGEAGRGK
jgi:nucleoside-diphosphate-sugar epimerase